ncbi:MAG: CSLREA domain-containing protein [Deltaproteobacteria bacterium]|nr:CSLREA domain-containing protein [Deltaproteobacteria bacterium]
MARVLRFPSFVLAVLSALVAPRPSSAAPLAPDVVPLAVAAAGAPTALASADLDADGMPDLIVAYAEGGATTLVAYPGDAEAVYPTPGAPRALAGSPFGTPRVLASMDGRVSALTAVDVDADGLKDIVAERALGTAALLVGIGDGTVVEADVLDAAAVGAARARAVALAPSHLTPAASVPLAAVPEAFAVASADGGVGGFRTRQEVRRALARPAPPLALTAPADAAAVLPMRLNRDAVPDLVVLRPGLPAPEVLLSRAAATFVVTTTADENGACDASCSLREAIVAANATPDLDTIEFAIPASDPGFRPGTGSWLITPQGSEYPVITAPVTLDGRTQPGFVDVPVVELSGEAFSDGRTALILSAPNNVVRGLIVSAWPALRENGESFCGCGIMLSGASNSIVEGNYVGTDATGLQAKPNGQNGIAIISGSNNLIGGTTAQARNVVSGNREQFFFDVGIATFISSAAANNTIAGNYVGIDAAGFHALPNREGIILNSANNTVGGTDPGAGNVVAGNVGNQVTVFEVSASADGNSILRNLVGTDAAGLGAFDEGFGYGVSISDADAAVVGSPGNGNLIAGNDYGILIHFAAHRSTGGHVVQGNQIGVDAVGRPLGNGGPGLRLDNVFDATIGGTANGAPNLVANNTGPGVLVNFVPTCAGCTTGTLRANQNRISANRIFANSGRGIDLGSSSFGDGVTMNDATDADSGANDLLNWPVLTSATSDAMTSTVNAQALTQGPASAQPYRLEFFASPACDTVGGNGEGAFFLGAADRSADGSAIAVNLPVPIPNGYVVTATATDSLGNTSEFSNCVTASGGPAPAASATPTPAATATVEKTPGPGATPTVAPTNVPGVEICDNCRDDDGDTIVDRADPDCKRPWANGLGAGVATRARAKVAAKCQGAIAKGGQALVAKERKLLQGCLQKMLACVELKPGDQGCVGKASAGCQKVSTTIAALEGKLEDKIEKACGEPPMLEADLQSAAGLGYGDERATCAASFITARDANGVARCVHSRHQCQAEQMVSIENPRARELLQAAGVSLFGFGCLLNPGANGGGQGVGDPARAKLLVKCASAVQKAAAKFAASRLGGLQKCVAAMTKCAQLKPGDAGCLAGARRKCAGIAAKIGDGPKGAGTKARAAIAKACNGVETELLATDGLGQTALATYCSAVGVSPLATAGDVGECLLRHHACRVGQLLDAETPRGRELLDFGGIAP